MIALAIVVAVLASILCRCLLRNEQAKVPSPPEPISMVKNPQYVSSALSSKAQAPNPPSVTNQLPRVANDGKEVQRELPQTPGHTENPSQSQQNSAKESQQVREVTYTQVVPKYQRIEENRAQAAYLTIVPRGRECAVPIVPKKPGNDGYEPVKNPPPRYENTSKLEFATFGFNSLNKTDAAKLSVHRGACQNNNVITPPEIQVPNGFD